MNLRLLFHACAKFLLGLLTTGLLIFLPAGTLRFWKGWLLMAVLFLPMFLAGLILWAKAPQRLEKRLRAKEPDRTQQLVLLFSLVLFVGGFLIAGLDARFGWSRLPDWVSLGAAVIFLFSYGLYAEVLRENAYLSRTVEIQQGQTLVDTGLYGVVRHPMYFATVFLFLSMPLILGSVWSFLLFLLYPVLLVQRIRKEEALLKAELAGYEAYTHRVRYRLIPFLW